MLCSLYLPRSLNVLLAGKHKSGVLLLPVSSLVLRLVSTAVLHPAAALLRRLAVRRDVQVFFFPSLPSLPPLLLRPPGINILFSDQETESKHRREMPSGPICDQRRRELG